MGLDMYAYAVQKPGCRNHADCLLLRVLALACTKEQENPDVDLKRGGTEIFYWRKHPNLHGWMGKLYYQKGGKQYDFNGATVKLTLADLALLEADVSANRLPHTTGFFFGSSRSDYIERDEEFIATARRYIADGYDIYYDSCW